MHRSRRTARTAVAGLVVAGAVLLAAAAPTSIHLPFGPNGSVLDGTAGAPVPMDSTTVLVPVTGADGAVGTGDDLVVVMSPFQATAPFPLATPFLPALTGGLERLSANRALVSTAGPDGTWGTVDDAVVLLYDLVTSNNAVPVTVGHLRLGDDSVPVRLTHDSAVVATLGPDGTADTSDDRVALLHDLGGANLITWLPAPFLAPSPRTRPAVLDPTTILVASDGLDAASGTADDVTYLFEDVGGTNARTTLPTPRLFAQEPGRPVRLSPDRALVASSGADGTDGTPDDLLLLLDKLGTANKVTSFSVPSIQVNGAGLPTPLSPDAAVVATAGPDGTASTNDDQVFLVSKLGSQNTAVPIPVPGIDNDGEARPVRLSATSCAVVTTGGDLTPETADDQVAILSDLGGTVTVAPVPLPGLAGQVVSRPTVLSPSSVLVTTGGPNATLAAGADDAVALVEGLPGAPAPTFVGTTGDAISRVAAGQVPRLLGERRAALLATGGNSAVGGGDDGIQVLADLPAAGGLAVLKAKLKFQAEKPEKGEKATVKATLDLPQPDRFAASDLVVNLGAATQTLPAASVVEKKPGLFVYSDRTGAAGFLRKLVFKAKKGKLVLKAKGLSSGIENTPPGRLLLALGGEEFHFGEALVGTATRKGIQYKRPK